MYKTEQEKLWTGEFGLNYINRNNFKIPSYNKADPAAIFSRWLKMLHATNNVKSIREFGCNIGLNLVALKYLQPSLQLSGYEINKEAVRQAKEFKVAKIKECSILEKIEDEKVDLTFTCCTLMHINPDYLNKVYDNLVNGSNKYVLVAEFYNPTPTKITYHGQENTLFKRDFAGELIDNYGLKLVDYGFIYMRDNWEPKDTILNDVTWFLLEK
jgi:pseudaminic acid biosynthesis-associated methylase